MRCYFFITVLAFTFLQRSTASLEVKGPTEPILEGQDVTLECLDTESELNMSTVHFERLSKHYMKKWYRLESDQAYFYRRCFLYDVWCVEILRNPHGDRDSEKKSTYLN